VKIFDNVTEIVRDDLAQTIKRGSKNEVTDMDISQDSSFRRAGHKWMLRPFMRLPLGIPKPFFTFPCGCAFLRNASGVFYSCPKNQKNRAGHQVVF